MTRFAVTLSTIAALFVAGPVVAQTKAPAPADAKFVAADKDKSGMLEGTELTQYQADMAKIDTNKDGKISKTEFEAAEKSGVIK